MKTAFWTALERGQWYIGEGWHYLLFLAALLFLLWNRKEKQNRRWLAGYCILFLLVYICPVTAKVIMKYCVGDLVYWRMFWLLPASVVIAYMAVRICKMGKSRMLQTIAVLGMLALIALTGKNPYLGKDVPYQKAVNMHKLPADVCQICDQIAGSREEQEKAVAVMPDELIGYVRQYDASIELVYGRRSKLRKRRKKIHRQMNRENPNFRRLIRMLRRSGVNYLVYLADEEQDQQIESLGFTQVGKAGDYILYKDTQYTSKNS